MNDIVRWSRRRGATLIELLLVVLILAVLAILLVPAVQYSRDLARRATCLNNLHQIGVGLKNYTSVFSVMPQGTTGAGYSFISMLLPALDAGAVYNSINFSVSATTLSLNHPNFTVSSISLSYLLCPADPNSGPGRTTNYAGNNGIRFPGFVRPGVFDGPDSVSLASITDGLSNTVAVAEIVQGPLDWRGRNPMGSVFALSLPPKSGRDGADRMLNTCREVNPAMASVHSNLKGKN